MERRERDRRRTLLLVSLASVMERADEALLPAVYREVGAALHATPAGLGALTLCRSIVQAACYPLAAYAAACYREEGTRYFVAEIRKEILLRPKI